MEVQEEASQLGECNLGWFLCCVKAQSFSKPKTLTRNTCSTVQTQVNPFLSSNFTLSRSLSLSLSLYTPSLFLSLSDLARPSDPTLTSPCSAVLPPPSSPESPADASPPTYRQRPPPIRASRRPGRK